MFRIVAIALTLAAFAAAPVAAEPVKGKRSKSSVQRLAIWPGASSMAPARMIEVRPGYWVSSYGCVWEDAQGRLQDCQINGDPR